MRWTGFAFSTVGLACVGYGLTQSETAVVLDCVEFEPRMCVQTWRVWSGCGLILAMTGMLVSVSGVE